MSPEPKRSVARKRAAKKLAKKRTPTKAAKQRAAKKGVKKPPPPMAAKRGRLTNVALLREAGILTEDQYIAPEYELVINALTRGDINALIRALPDASYPGEVIPGIGREFIIV